MIKAGIPIRRSFDILANSQKKPALKQIIREINNDIYLGDSLAKSLRNYAHQFNHIFCNMVNVGEESGSLASILAKASQIYESDIELLLDTIIPLIEPVMMIVLGIVIGGLLVAMYLPVFQLGHIY